ncbi:hypothetical protein CsSME_00019100 [Camellia sinensis var. sinensis]
MEEHEQALELEGRHFSELQLAPKAMNHHHQYFGYPMDELKLSEGFSTVTCNHYYYYVIYLYTKSSFVYPSCFFPFSPFDASARAEQSEFQSADGFNYLLDVLNNGSTTDDNVRHINTNYNDQERYAKLCFSIKSFHKTSRKPCLSVFCFLLSVFIFWKSHFTCLPNSFWDFFF